MEMSAYDKAAEIFRTALHFIDENSPEGHAKSVATHIPTCAAYLEAGRNHSRPFKSYTPWFDDEISLGDKVEFFRALAAKVSPSSATWKSPGKSAKVSQFDPHGPEQIRQLDTLLAVGGAEDEHGEVDSG